MNRFKTALLIACAGMTLAGAAQAQIFWQMGPLTGMGQRSTLLGVYMGMGNGDVNPSAELRVSSGHAATMGIAASVENSAFGAQADVRAGLTGTGSDSPLELGGQLAGGLLTGGGSTGIYAQVVPGLSFEWGVGEGRAFSTWAGLGYRLTASSRSVGDGAGIARLGTRYDFSPSMGLGASLEAVGGASKLFLGGDYTF